MPPTGSAGTPAPTAPGAPTAPTIPTPTTPQPGARADTLASLWGMIIDPLGACIPGATAQIERGGVLGPVVTQDPVCDAWAYGGGFTLQGLAPGVEITLFVSAPGYASREAKVTPVMSQGAAVLIVLAGGGQAPVTSGMLARVSPTNARFDDRDHGCGVCLHSRLRAQ